MRLARSPVGTMPAMQTSATPGASTMAVGFVGLGVMGRPMARRILAAGFALTVHSRSRAAVAELAASGADAGASPADVASRADVVIVMVPDAPDVEAVLAAPDGILAGARHGLVVAAMGTHHPAAMPPLAELCAARRRPSPRCAGVRWRGRRDRGKPVDHGRWRRSRLRAGEAGLRGDGPDDRAGRRVRRGSAREGMQSADRRCDDRGRRRGADARPRRGGRSWRSSGQH